MNVQHKLISLEAVLKDLQNSVSPSAGDEGDEFKRMFVSSGGKTYPDFSKLSLEMISGFSVSIYMVF